MLYREIIAVCSEIHIKHINALWAEQNLCMLKLFVRKVSLGLWKVNTPHHTLGLSVWTTYYGVHLTANKLNSFPDLSELSHRGYSAYLNASLELASDKM